MPAADSVDIVFKGPQTIENVVDNRQRLLEALQKSDCLGIDLQEVTEMDFSFLQLLYSACRTAERRKKRIQIMNASGAFLQMVHESGMSGRIPMQDIS